MGTFCLPNWEPCAAAAAAAAARGALVCTGVCGRVSLYRPAVCTSGRTPAYERCMIGGSGQRFSSFPHGALQAQTLKNLMVDGTISSNCLTDPVLSLGRPLNPIHLNHQS